MALHKGKVPINVGSIASNSTELKFSLKFLSSERFDPDKKEKQEARRYIFNSFKSFGLKALQQPFKAPYVKVSCESGRVNLGALKRMGYSLVPRSELDRHQSRIDEA